MCLNDVDPGGVSTGDCFSEEVSGHRRAFSSEGMKLKIKSMRERLLASTFIVGALALTSANQASAQASAPDSGPVSQRGDTGAPVTGGVPGNAVTIGGPTATGVAVSTNGQGPNSVAEVVVTGSRIPQPNLSSDSPLTTVTSQEFKLEGTTDVSTLLNNLPQFTAAQNSTEVNGSNGTSQANLRNLGPTRTLVLVNGRRLNPGDPGDPVADLNEIPAALVDRVDVVTGGASAVYGSDAVAGVVNFILKQNFQGVQFDVQGGFNNHQQHNGVLDQALAGGIGGDGVALPKPGDVGADGGNLIASVILGSNSPDGKGNVTAYLQYRNNKPVLQGARDFSECGTADTGTGLECLGSSNSAYGRFDAVTTGFTAAGAPIHGNVANNPNGTNTFVPYSGAFAYNFNPLNFVARDDNRYSAGFEGHYTITPAVEVYSEFLFQDDETNAQIAPSGLFRSSGPNLSNGYSINCNNPFLSAQQSSELCPGVAVTPGAAGGSFDNLQSIGYRFQSVPRNTDFHHTDYKIDLGFRGDLPQGWHYDVYGQFGQSLLQNLTTGYASENKVQNALDVIDVNGVPTCVSGGSCVPLNIFQSLSRGLTPAAINYVLTPALTTGETQENVVSGNVSGDLGQYGLKSPYADTGVGVDFGAEYRREQLSETFDQEQLSGDLSGGGGAAPPANGSFDVYELFTEVRVPIVSNLPFAKEITFDAGYRYSDYSTAGDTNTYKFEGDWAPSQDVRLRGSFNRAVRAPNAVELFLPRVTGLGTYSDPCASDAGAPTFTLAQCERTGVTAAQYGNVEQCASSQCSIQTGGNTALRPETALTYSGGAVLTPRYIKNFSFSVDYFHIKVKNVIGAGAGPLSILQACADGTDNPATDPNCQLIHRDAQGTLNSATGFVQQDAINSGYLLTDGIDVAASYRVRLGDVPYVGHYAESFGSLAFNVVGTWTHQLTLQPVSNGGAYNCSGLFGPTCGQPQPHWKSEFRTTWLAPAGVTLSANWRYLGSSTSDLNSTNPFLTAGPGFADAFEDQKIERYNYLDLTVTYKVRDNATLRAGVINVFDKDPPVVDSNAIGVSGPANFGNANTYPGIYDVLGRQLFFGLTADF